MHAYLRVQPSPALEFSREHAETMRAMNAAATEDERMSIWDESGHRAAERWDRQRQELSGRFGDRVRYVLTEYERRGMISESKVRHLEWLAQSANWLHEAASELGALARRL